MSVIESIAGMTTAPEPGRSPVRRWPAFLACAALVALSGCFMIGPDYTRPEAPVSDDWIDRGDVIRAEPAVDHEWWKVFGDPALDSLVETAYHQNPSLQAAGARVLEALASRGIAIGTLFPQQQDAFGAYQRVKLSENRANQKKSHSNFDDWQAGFDASWELDVWGRLRRGIEAADAQVLASVALYDDVLVSLIAEVATNYISLRTFEERLGVARNNVEIQKASYDIAEAKFQGGAVTELDAAQAGSLLESTRALIPNLEASIRQTQNNLCILLGIPPQDLTDLLHGEQPIPTAPAQVAVGIPAELLRRRPDVRLAERQLAAQSARIGIAKADFLPRFSLVGTISLTAEDFADLFKGDSFEAFGGPNFRWAILNYGRISNNVRVQSAEYQALIGTYEDTVLRAQGEVESSIAAFLGARRQVENLQRSVSFAGRAVELADLQYREGAADYTRVLNTQQSLVTQQDQLVVTRGDVALSLTSLYKALGGGWEIRDGQGFVSDQAAEQMREQTRWGGLSTTEGQTEKVDAAATGTEAERGWWRWRWWWPQW
jgi:NodT family efflux transporter outer membrane factor (OMF) lipoprotein